MRALQVTHTEPHHSHFPEPGLLISASNNNYIITNQNDIRIKLNQLLNKNTLLSVQAPGRSVCSALLTTITHIEDGHIFLDGFQNEQFNRDLLMHDTLMVSGNFEGVAVSFMLSNPNACNMNSTFNIKATLPQNIEWLQRRDARRVKVPMSIPVMVKYKGESEYFNVRDISVAGLSYTYPLIEGYHPAAVGKRYTDCNIVLPNNNVFQANLEIANSVTLPYKYNKQINRVGCEIKKASYRLDTALQHLINQIDCHFQ
ncbi:MAG: flagellar brake protein [Methylobacter sp.]